ncbi:glycosyltransferase [uncultured Kocuria sp.]|uniref:glycosyltransferase n=1 Tax=uncultured Kocuria sp. TaxID=259305 RepID=UPI00261887E6|nr:glycosyltransferase [uncultured Kocuria sp.]
MPPTLRIVAVVPCHNEEAAIAKVVTDLHAAVPGIEVHVYDNCSTDGTAEAARRAGAQVRREEEKGKGNVVRRAFADLDADVYLLVDGDDTYDVADAPAMIDTLLSGPYDHVLGVRRQVTSTAYRSGHESGNRFFNGLVSFAFRRKVSDMLSGYRVFSRRFVKSFPALSREFEIETELTVHAVNARAPQAEVAVGFRDRAAGSESKLRTYHDGFRILGVFGQLLLHERPFLVTGAVSLALFLLGLVLGLPVVLEFAGTGLVPRFPTAFLAASLVVLAGVFLLMGVLLSGQAKIRRETSRLFYLRHPAPPWNGGDGPARRAGGHGAHDRRQVP